MLPSVGPGLMLKPMLLAAAAGGAEGSESGEPGGGEAGAWYTGTVPRKIGTSPYKLEWSPATEAVTCKEPDKS